MQSKKSLAKILLSTGISILAIQMPVYAEEITINNPKVQGYALDKCRLWARDCGLPAADAYCRSVGYARATDFQSEPTYQKTRIIYGGQICDGSYRSTPCDRITSVTCEEANVIAPL